MFGEKYTAWQDKNRGLLDRLGVLGVGISQLSAGQAPDISGAWQSVQARRDERKLGESMRNPALLAQFSPEQQKMLSTMPPQLAQQLIMEKVFAPPPAPVKPDWQQFDGSMYDMNAPGGPSVAIAGTNPADAKAAETAAERTQREADAAKLGYAPGSPEFNGYVVTGDLAPKPDVPKPTDDMQEYDFYSKQATGAGMKPLLFDDWMNAGRKAGATSVTVGGSSPAEISNFNKSVKASNVDTVISDILATDKGSWLPTTGMLGGILSGVGGTAAGDIKSNIETLRAAASFSSLQAMREASKTGAALGAVSDTETKLLGSELANLEQSQSHEQFIRNLKRFQIAYNTIVDGPLGGPSGGAASGVPDGITPEEWGAMTPEDKALFQ